MKASASITSMTRATRSNAWSITGYPPSTTCRPSIAATAEPYAGHRRWATPRSLEHRAVGCHRNRRGTIGRTQRARDFSSRAPGAALQQLRHGEACIESQLFSHQANQWIHQRHRQRAPFDDELGADLVPQRWIDRRARADHAEIDEEAAVAIFGERGELVQPLHGEPRRLERLGERIGEPLRELVEGHDPIGGVAGAHGGMTAGIADRTSLEREGGRPDRR